MHQKPPRPFISTNIFFFLPLPGHCALILIILIISSSPQWSPVSASPEVHQQRAPRISKRYDLRLVWDLSIHRGLRPCCTIRGWFFWGGGTVMLEVILQRHRLLPTLTGLDMRLLGLLAVVLLLEVSCCQSNRPTRPGGKPAKKTGAQGASVPRAPPAEEDSPAAPGGGGAEGPVEAATEAQPGGPVVGQQAEAMRLQYLRNPQVTCNDGSAAGYAALDRTSISHSYHIRVTSGGLLCSTTVLGTNTLLYLI
ncbi:unnamed protein product [Gadus morhua 'NCC']